MTKSGIFIKKDHPNSATADYQYVLPSTYDLTTQPPVADNNGATTTTETPLSPPIGNSTETNSNGNSNTNKNKNTKSPPGVPGDNTTNTNSPFSTLQTN